MENFNIRSREEVITLCSSRKYSQKRLTELRSLNEHESDSISVSSGSANAGPSFESETSISANDEFELMKNLCEVLFQQKRYAELQRVAFSSLGSRIFNKKEEIIKEVEFLCLISAFLNKDAHLAYNYVRELVIKDVKNSKLWNLFNIMITDSDDTRCVKVVSVLIVWIFFFFFANTKRLIPKIFHTYSGPENQAKIANPIPIRTLIRPKSCLIFELSLPLTANLALEGSC